MKKPIDLATPFNLLIDEAIEKNAITVDEGRLLNNTFGQTMRAIYDQRMLNLLIPRVTELVGPSTGIPLNS